MKTHSAEEVTTGYHPRGYRIDKTASPMNRYTQWEIDPDGTWVKPKPVCFHALPEDGWATVDKFEWGDIESKQ
jgi:hypothetical protein